jgi:hypothetical protein
MKKGPRYMKFIFEVPNLNVDDMFTHNVFLDHIEKDKDNIRNDTEQLYKFRGSTANQGPLRSSDKDDRGSWYNVLVEWETGETVLSMPNNMVFLILIDGKVPRH